jgi:hypothetical protein
VSNVDTKPFMDAEQSRYIFADKTSDSGGGLHS